MVSKRVGRLEQRLGVRLLARTTRKLNLTEAGALFHERCLRILAEIEEAETAVSAERAQPRGTLRVTTSAAFGRLHVAPLIKDFIARYPELRIHLYLTERTMDLVEEGYDMAIRIGDLADSSLVARVLAPNRRVVCASPAYLKRYGVPRVPADLVHHNCLFVSEAGRRQDVWRLLGPSGPETVRVTGTLECNNGEVIHQWALDGLGVALKSTWDVGENLQKGKLKAVFPEHTPRGVNIYAVYPHRQYVPAKVKLFAEFLQKAYGPVPYWEKGLELERRAGRAAKEPKRAKH
jgi:DNA-binding transcriptional LysR family regulator